MLTPLRSSMLPPGVIPGPGEGSAAEEGVAEAGALLVGEADDLERERQPAAAAADAVDDLDGEHHAEHPVVAARVGDGVEVAAEHQGGQVGLGALESTALVADGVLPGVESGFAHPGRDERVGHLVLGREVDALERAIEGADPGERFAVRESAGGSRGNGGRNMLHSDAAVAALA